MILANALDHIAKSAAASRTSTRRLRWIERRALIALKGQEYSDTSFDLPKSSGPNTLEKLQKRMAYHIAVKHDLLETLKGVRHLIADAAELQIVDSVIAGAEESITATPEAKP
tara:strand:- start:1110 stop:1448 length:339 start_codon:yes stop_codon:yes gene_type:complete